MATSPVPIVVNQWTKVYTGPTEGISVEACFPGPDVWVASSDAEPPFTGKGHYLAAGHIKGVTLKAGENLYAWTSGGPSGYPELCVIITD